MATITLSGTSVDENPDVGTIIGIISVDGAQTDETFTYTLADSLADRFEIKEVTIDGVSKGTIDLYSAAIEWRSKVRFCCVPRGKHTAVIRITGKSNPNSTGRFVDVDGFTVEAEK